MLLVSNNRSSCLEQSSFYLEQSVRGRLASGAQAAAGLERCGKRRKEDEAGKRRRRSWADLLPGLGRE
jgi:hypothetical protein